MYGGMCTGFYLQSMLSLVAIAKQAEVELSCSFMFNESLIQRARNGLTHQFLKTECTHLMFIDADIRFDGNDILSMVAADKDIICGLYPKKEINWQQVALSAAAGVPVDQLKNHTGAMVVNLVGQEGEVIVPRVSLWRSSTVGLASCSSSVRCLNHSSRLWLPTTMMCWTRQARSSLT
jgi:hypothetical protein